VIGVDDFFFGLYMAKNWIAPKAGYICCAADTALPFADASFSVAFCSDAFHYFVHKVTSLRELTRIVERDGFIISVWMHNALWRCAHDGLPLPPEGYDALLGDMPHRLVADTDVLTRYLRKQGPALARSADHKALTRAPLLSLVASHRPEIFQDYGEFADWPHAAGSLGLNPLYVVEDQAQHGMVQLRRTFPSAFYEAEHAQCKMYLPETVQVPRTILDNIMHGQRIPEVESLIEQYVVLGMPDRYRRSPQERDLGFLGTAGEA
jgi:SAM-dependent methyltransferase